MEVNEGLDQAVLSDADKLLCQGDDLICRVERLGLALNERLTTLQRLPGAVDEVEQLGLAEHERLAVACMQFQSALLGHAQRRRLLLFGERLIRVLQVFLQGLGLICVPVFPSRDISEVALSRSGGLGCRSVAHPSSIVHHLDGMRKPPVLSADVFAGEKVPLHANQCHPTVDEQRLGRRSHLELEGGKEKVEIGAMVLQVFLEPTPGFMAIPGIKDAHHQRKLGIAAAGAFNIRHLLRQSLAIGDRRLQLGV